MLSLVRWGDVSSVIRQKFKRWNLSLQSCHLCANFIPLGFLGAIVFHGCVISFNYDCLRESCNQTQTSITTNICTVHLLDGPPFCSQHGLGKNGFAVF